MFYEKKENVKMPMFYTPKPRQFHYAPRLYDPEKEEWEKLKTKYRLEKGLPLSDEELQQSVQKPVDETAADNANDDLAYFQRRVRDLDRQDREKQQKLTFNDLFRKREKPQFHYVSRFDDEGNLIENPSELKSENITAHKIRHRFDNDDMDRLKPVPAGKIIIYTLAVCILLIFIFS